MTCGAPVKVPLSERVACLVPPAATVEDRIRVAESVIGVGMRIAGIVHEEDPAEAWELYRGLDDDRKEALVFVLAAMVDIDQSARELLGWAPFATPDALMGATSKSPASVLLRSRPRPTRLMECGTKAAFDRHKAHGEEPCDACWTAHRAWEADKKAAQRARRRAAHDPRVGHRATAARAALAAVHRIREVQPDLFSTLEPDTKQETSDAAA